ncbi:MAG: malto-oligosyltrehalose synthase [Acidobacteriota bacterium]|jgi:(1->4)-alpha-D-glucan 1-alpha-D-glucosylmutase
MTEGELLDGLAELCGIVPAYHDIWGELRTVGPGTKRSLLASMGVRASSPEELLHEYRRRADLPWREVLPPVVVVEEPAGNLEVPLTLPEARAGEPFVARIEAEDGRAFERPFRPRELPETDRREVDGVVHVRRRLGIAAEPGLGYHRLTLRTEEGIVAGRMRLIVAPARCWVPEALQGEGRVWGPTVQLASLRGAADWGVGDFGGLDRLARTCGTLGAGVLGLNPLHALFPANPRHASPYSPSSRAMLHVLYLDAEAVPEFAECREARDLLAEPAFQARLADLRGRDLIDWAGVAGAKREMLEILWRHFRRVHLDGDTPRGREFRDFVRDRGPRFASYGAFEALEERFRAAGAWGWPAWPEEYRRPDSPAVARFAEEHPERVAFFQWLQWECDRQLAAVGRTCLDQGLGVGLYLDLAVSVDRAGFEAWSWQDVFAADAGIGAPPDDFNLKGQDWGLPPWIPEELRRAGYEPFVEVLRANMRHAGALRIDHVMGLMRSFWIPPGMPATEGAYVLYPFRDLLGILALESVRNRCLVVGEDLGTVPEEVRSALAPLGVLSYRLLYFARGGEGEFLAPAAFPRRSLVAPTTHDLPTLAGWWRAHDIALRAELGLFPDEQRHEEQLAERGRDRGRLLSALRREGLLDEEGVSLAGMQEDLTPEVRIALHRYLARTPSMVMTFQLEDTLGQVEQVNLPGTVDEYPNWRRRLSEDLETLAGDRRLLDLADALREERGPGSAPQAREGAAAAGEAPIPRATYRLQLHRDFPLQAAADLVPYLARLGVSHVYASPVLQARPGSRHGYDIIDHGHVSREIGGAVALKRLVETLRRHGMGLVLDIVPNHMGVGSDNAWWMSLLEHGRTSPYASFFDVDWRPHKQALRGRVLLPLLEDHYGRVLERGLLRLRFEADRGAFEVHYAGHRFPVDPGSYPLVLSHDLDRLQARLGTHDPRMLELGSLIDAFRNLPARDETEPDRIEARLRDAEVQRRQLARLVGECEEIASFLDTNVTRFSGRPGEPDSFDLLDGLLGLQAYRLAFWRTAADEINYRRFFDINDLAALRQEDPAVFEATHRLVLDLVRRGWVDGLRIDHPDGLHDPAGYYRRLVEELRGSPVWTVAEKILAPHERLPPEWPVHGTTGYDFCNLVGALFVDPAGERAHDRIYHRFAGHRMDPDRILYDAKHLILETALASELTVLTDELDRVSEADRRTRDFTRPRLRHALAEVIACFPVYRTYVTETSVTDQDRHYVERAIDRARLRDRASETSIYDFLREVLTPGSSGGVNAAARAGFARKFQQTTSPVKAKGLEDTAFYIYNRLLALNEVGGDPRRFGLSVAAFHRANGERAERWPHSMLCSSTHDTKRSEDVRSRIAVLSEMPGRWERTVRRFGALNRPYKRRVGRHLAPSRNDEYAIYQTLIGIWPDAPVDADSLGELRERVQGWALKAVREAKVHSSWMQPDDAYEDAVRGFLDGILATPDGPFLAELLPLQRFVAGVGAAHAVSGTLLKLTVPGVPDIYQGQEIVEPTLVDPDNRRPVDFERRRRILAELQAIADGDAAGVGELTRSLPDGRAKLWVTWRALDLRRRSPALFREGGYRPLETGGEHADRLVAFARDHGDETAVVVAPRLLSGICDPTAGRHPVGEVWGDTWIDAAGSWRDLLGGGIADGERLRAAELLARFPAALLVRG